MMNCGTGPKADKAFLANARVVMINAYCELLRVKCNLLKLVICVKFTNTEEMGMEKS